MFSYFLTLFIQFVEKKRLHWHFKKVIRFRVNSQSSVLLENIGQLDSIIVYFDQLLGAARTQKLVEILFSAVFHLFCFSRHI